MLGSTHRLTAILDLRDRLSNKMRKSVEQMERLKRSTNGTKKSLKDTDVVLDRTGRRMKKLTAETVLTIAAFDRFLLAVNAVNKSAAARGINLLLDKFMKVSSRVVKFGLVGGALAGGLFLGSSINKAMDFEAQMASIQALTNISDTELSQMQALALKAGADTKYNALEAAQAIEELVKAGLSTSQVQNGGLTAALNLATAGELGLADAAEIMSTALNTFRKDGMTAAQAADILAGTANASATDVEELRYALQQSSAVAAGTGLSFKDTATALGIFANYGLKGSDAGTSLKVMLQNLQPDTDDQIALFKELGLLTKDNNNLFFDAKGNLKGLADVSGILRKALEKLTNQQRMKALEELFGTDALRAANLLYEAGAEGVEEFYKEMSRTTALDVARRKMDTAAGAVEQFRGAIETLQISALLPTMPIIKNLANSAADFVTEHTPQITAAVENTLARVGKYIRENFTDNPEFQQLTTLRAKVAFVFDKFHESLQNWLDKGGKEQIQKAAESLTDMMIASLETYGPRIASLMATIGRDAITSFFKGMVESYNLWQADNPLDRFLAKLWGTDTWGAGTGIMYDENGNPMKYKKPPTGTTSGGSTYSGSRGSFGPSAPISRDQFNSHAGGLERVPYNGYLTSLHKDERVLTAEENEEYTHRQGQGGAKIIIQKIADQVHIRDDGDIDKLAAALARRLKEVGGLV